MNKTLAAILLLGLVVAALAGDAARANKLKLQKAKVLAKKNRMEIEKAKGVAGLRPDALAAKYKELPLTPEQFTDRARDLKDQAKRAKAAGFPTRQKGVKNTDAGRNKRSTKERAMNKRKAKKAIKSRKDD